MYTPKPLGVAALLLAGLALTACGNSGSKASSDTSLTPAPSSLSASPTTGATDPSQPADAKAAAICGKIQMKGNEETVVRVKGTTPCKTLMNVINAYDKAAKKGPNGEATVDGWKCKTASPAETQKHGYITICTKGAAEFATKLH